MREPITDAELEQWATVRADDAGHLARELMAHRRAGQPMQHAAWRPIAEADRSIATVQTFLDVGITLRNSHPIWVRDDDGRAYEAVWTDHRGGYWWDLEGESPVDPVEFMPHPLDPRWSAPTDTSGSEPCL